MRLEIYAVHDSAVGAFNQPLFFRTRGEAIRAFEDGVGNRDSNFVRHPEHYAFYHIGYYDDGSGLLEPVAPDRVCGAVDFVIK